MGRTHIGKSQIAGGCSARAAGRSAAVSWLLASFVLALALTLAYGQASASASTPAKWLLNGEFVTKTLSTTTHGNIKLLQPSSGIYIACEDTMEGTVGAESASTISKVTFSKCSSFSGCEGGATIEARDLPWGAEILVPQYTPLYLMRGKPESELRMFCTVFGYKSTIDCWGALAGEAKNGASGVTVAFYPNDPEMHLDCNGVVGTLEGTQTVEATKGGKLEFAFF